MPNASEKLDEVNSKITALAVLRLAWKELGDEVFLTVRETVNDGDKESLLSVRDRADLGMRQVKALMAANYLNQEHAGTVIGNLWPYDGRGCCKDQRLLYVYAKDHNNLFSGWIQGKGASWPAGGYKVEVDVSDCEEIWDMVNKFRNMWTNPKNRTEWVKG